MKKLVILLIITSTLLGGCNKELLDGLNLKFKGEFNSDYKEKTEQENQNFSQSDRQTNNHTSDKIDDEVIPENSSEKVEENQPELFRKKPVTEVNNSSNQDSTNDPDAPMAFKQLKECTEAGITAKTNEEFYSQNPNLKSIDSKNPQQLKAWKSLYQEIQQECDNN